MVLVRILTCIILTLVLVRKLTCIIFTIVIVRELTCIIFTIVLVRGPSVLFILNIPVNLTSRPEAASPYMYLVIMISFIFLGLMICKISLKKVSTCS